MRSFGLPRGLVGLIAPLVGTLLFVGPDSSSRAASKVDARQNAGDIIGAVSIKSSTFERPQYVLGSEKWGPQTLGTAGDIPWSLFDPVNGVSRLQPNGSPYVAVPMKARQLSTIRQTQHMWEQVANVRFVEGADTASVTRVRVGQGDFGAGLDNGSNNFALADLPCAACLSVRGPNLVSFSSQLFQDSRQSETALIDIALHEFGHAIGLQHELAKSSVMGQGQRSKSFINLKGLTDDDIAAAQALYGANSNPVKVIEDDVEGTASTDTFLSPGQVFSGRVETPADEDWFRVQLIPGNDYVITARPAGIAPLIRLKLTLLFNEGAVSDTAAWPLMSSTAPADGRAAMIAITPQFSGHFWIAVQGATEAMTGGYALDIQEQSRLPAGSPGAAPTTDTVISETVDFAGDMSSVGTITVGQTVKGSVGTGGDASDWIKLKLPPFHRYLIALKGVDGGGGTLADPVLLFRGPEGQVYAVRDDTAGTRDSSLIFYQNFDEDDWLEVKGFGTSAGTYTLGVSEISTEPTALDILTATPAPNDAATTAALALDLPTSGRIGAPSEVHAYRALLSADNSYTITADPTSAGGVQHFWISLSGPDGSLLAQAKAVPGQSAFLTYRPTVSGLYVARVASFDFSETGSYRVTLGYNQDLGGDDAQDVPYILTGPKVSTTAGVDLRLNGIDDRDWISADVEAGAWYLVQAAPATGATMTAPVIVGVGSPSYTNIDTYKNAPLPTGGYDSAAVYVRSVAGGTIHFFVMSNAFGAAFGDGRYHASITRRDPPASLLADALHIP